MNIIADNTIPYLKGIIEQFANVQYLTSGQFTANAVREADVLIVRSVDKCTREILEGSKIKLITTATIGFDHIDTAYCKEAGISWKNAPGSNAVSVAQYLLASLVHISIQTGEVLSGKTLGIVGVGHVGKEVEKLCKPLGIKVLRNDPPRANKEGNDQFVSLETIASESDIITFHTPLTKEGNYPTFHLADETFFNQLKRKPWFINASRGAVHDTQALLKAKKEGLISQLILDCWENEPHIDTELLDITTVATPHIAGFSADGKANATRMCLENIGTFFQIQIPDIHKVQPAAPANPTIDLNQFRNHRIENCILTSFNPAPIDQALRESPGKFEWFRANYTHPREFAAYTVTGATSTEAQLLERLGFKLTI